jgi:hypothetical protein
MASKDVAPVLAREFVTLKLDYDRAKGAKDVERRYIEKEQGLPWFVFLDGDGKALIHSTGPKGNAGFPAQPDEIAHFKTMLETVKRHLTDEQIAFLVASLEEANRKK